MHALLAAYNESERAAYMQVLAYMANADGNISSEEVYLLQQMCLRFVLGPDARGEVMVSTTMSRQELDKVLAHLAPSGLKYSLLLDLCVLARADENLREGEEHAIRDIATALQIDGPRVEAILSLSKTVHEALAADPANAHKKIEEGLAAQESTIPRSELAISASLEMVDEPR